MAIGILHGDTLPFNSNYKILIIYFFVYFSYIQTFQPLITFLYCQFSHFQRPVITMFRFISTSCEETPFFQRLFYKIPCDVAVRTSNAENTSFLMATLNTLCFYLWYFSFAL